VYRTTEKRRRTYGSRTFWIIVGFNVLAFALLRFGTSGEGQAFLVRAGVGGLVLPKLANQLDVQLAERFARMGLGRSDIQYRRVALGKQSVREYTFACPQHLTPTLVHVQVQDATHEANGTVLGAEEQHGRGDQLDLVLGYGRTPTHRLIVRAPPPPPRDVAGAPRKPRVALVVVDLGHNLNRTTKGFFALDIPITVAVLPDLGKSDEVFELAAKRHIPALLHLPMEPEGGADPGKRPVKVGMSQDEIQALVDRHLNRYRTFFGVNNHMGSRATADPQTMAGLLHALRRRDLVFVDSQTTPKSVGRSAAREAGVRCVANDVFLDDGEGTVDEVAANLERLAALARKRGMAVGIAHPHAATLDALRANVPRLQAHGIEFVSLDWLRSPASGSTGPASAGREGRAEPSGGWVASRTRGR
jgi:polysaccharide deacetylase 2 family uncharacterized protein YibQ